MWFWSSCTARLDCVVKAKSLVQDDLVSPLNEGLRLLPVPKQVIHMLCLKDLER